MLPNGLEISGHALKLLYLLSASAKISITTLWKNIRQPDIKEWCEEVELCQGSTNIAYACRGSWHILFFHLALFFSDYRSYSIKLRILLRLLILVQIISTGSFGQEWANFKKICSLRSFQTNISGFRCLSVLLHLI